MKEPNHKVKRRREDFINDDKIHSLYVDDNSDTVIYDHFGWLGSGVLDKNGVEIYEGDVVILGNQRGVVRFDNAQFYIDRNAVPVSDDPEDEILPFTLNRLCSPFIEVVGHIAEEQNHED